MQSDIVSNANKPLRLRSIHLYPVKSLAGMTVKNWPLSARGLRHDRDWMLVNEQGRFLSQRQLPRMALIRATVDQNSLCLQTPNGDRRRLALDSPPLDVTGIQIWNDRLPALHLDPSIDHWLSDFLDFPCRLVRFADNQQRPVDPDYACSDDQTGFSDGFPFLIIGSASLGELNSRLTKPVEMARFRPNLVIGTGEPHCEDDWRRIRINGIGFRLVKPCSRCKITHVDPATGANDPDGPLQALAGYRKQKNRVMFGQNALHDDQGVLRTGTKVEVVI